MSIKTWLRLKMHLEYTMANFNELFQRSENIWCKVWRIIYSVNVQIRFLINVQCTSILIKSQMQVPWYSIFFYWIKNYNECFAFRIYDECMWTAVFIFLFKCRGKEVVWKLVKYIYMFKAHLEKIRPGVLITLIF